MRKDRKAIPKNCPVCGKLYIKDERGMCPSCYKEQTSRKDEVMQYLKDYPESTLEAVSEITGVHPSIIRRMAREGMFDDMEVRLSYPCPRCKKMISAGKVCDECRAFFEKSVHKARKRYEKAHPQAAYDRRKKIRVETERRIQIAKKIREDMELHLSHEQRVDQIDWEQVEKMTLQLMEHGKPVKDTKPGHRMFYLTSKEKRE